MSAPLWRSARLEYFRPAPSDAEAIFERYASDPDVTRYLGWPRHRSLEDTLWFLEFSRAAWERDGAGPLLIRCRADGELLGCTGLSVDAPGEVTTGYVLAKDAWGAGYATEALSAMVEFAKSLGIEELSALCHSEHRASWRVLEKVGFVRSARGARSFVFPNLGGGTEALLVRYERARG
jgi:ribosomal-protein-alanine N-acetyltransferase